MQATHSLQAGVATTSGWSPLRALSSVRGRLIAGFAISIGVLAIVASVSAWQAHVHRQNLADLESHSTTASLLQESEAQAGIAALLLQRYVTAGDESLVPEIDSHASAAVESLTEATARRSVTDISEIAVSGLGLTTGTGRIIALRQTGNVEASAAAMEEIVPIFRDFRLKLEDAAAAELQEVSALRSSAESTGDLALYLIIVSGTIGAIVGLFTLVLIARSIIRPLSSLEEAAAAVSDGDWAARAPIKGPRELARLGSVLNHMLGAVETYTEELRATNEQLQERNHQLTDARTQAATDPLTGLGNHRAFHKRIRDEVAEAQSAGSGLALILFDIDNFKNFNDSLGHLAGDDILRQIGAALTRVANPDDAYRYGGDEFAVMLPGSDIKDGSASAERLRVTFAGMAASDGQEVTVSLGVATFPDMATSAEELIYRADMAMYWAKSTGKNRVGDWDGLLSRRGEMPATQHLAHRDGKLRDAVASLVSALAAKDPVTRDHTERCAWYSGELAKELGLDEQEMGIVRLASVLHDIGKLAVPGEVLCKPGSLTEPEWVQIRQHPQTAFHILSTIDSVASAVPAILHHHEHYDGSGYPDGLKGDDIPIASRIISVADAFDAMTTDRPYRKAMSIEASLEELKRHSGSQFDPEVVDAFLRVIASQGAHPLRAMGAVEEPAAAWTPEA